MDSNVLKIEQVRHLRASLEHGRENDVSHPVGGRLFSFLRSRMESHPTDFRDTIQCVALLFAAIESAGKGGETIDVQDLLARHLKRTDGDFGS